MGNHSSKERKKSIQRRYSCPANDSSKLEQERTSNDSLQHSCSCSELGSSASSLNKRNEGSNESVGNIDGSYSVREIPLKSGDNSSILAANPSSLAALAKEKSSSQKSVHNSTSSMNDKYNINDIIQKIFDMRKNLKHGKSTSRSVGLKNGEIIKLCIHAKEIFLSQPVLIELNPKPSLVIAGDIHGQYSDLLRIFDRMGHPPKTNYLFMGDYVDRGKKSLETILLLLAYKIKYPENFFLLRGNHECASINRVYGFYDECKRRANLKVWKTFTDLFNCLPVAAVVAGKIFCVHGGLSPSLHTMDDILKIKRPTDIPEFDLLNDLLWSDPSETAQDWEDNERGVSYCFGKSVVQEFLTRNDFDLVCRAHMVVEDGYEFFGNRILVTVFSAPNYCGEFDNNGAVMLVNEDLLCSFEIIQALDANGEPINALSYSNEYVKETCPPVSEIPPLEEVNNNENGSNDLLSNSNSENRESSNENSEEKQEKIQEDTKDIENQLEKETEIIQREPKEDEKEDEKEKENEKEKEDEKEKEEQVKESNNVTEEIKEKTEEETKSTAEKVEEIKEEIQEKAEEIKEEIQEIAQEIKEDIQEVIEEVKENIEDNKEITKEAQETNQVKEETNNMPSS